MNIELIRWKDASGHTENIWREVDDMDDLVPAEVVTVGMVFKETEDAIIVVSSHDRTNDMYHGDMCILKANIQSRKVIPFA